MYFVEAIGLAAGFFSTVSLFPQVLLCYKTRHTKDLSWMWLALSTTGSFLWLLYGVYLPSVPLIAANSPSFLLVLSLAVLKFKYG